MEAPGIRRARDRGSGQRPVNCIAAVVLVLAAPLVLAACTAAAGGPPAGSLRRAALHKRSHAERPGAFGVGYGLVTWREARGSTENYATGLTSPGRVLRVELLYPTLGVKPPVVRTMAPPAYGFGPYPVIVFAHGYGVDPNTYRPLLVSWAEAGYVVVAPYFPDTNSLAIAAQGGADTESDMFNQPADVAFLVSQIVAAAHGSAVTRIGYLDRMLDPRRIILAGQSDGGDTIAGLMYDRAYAGVLAAMPVKPIAVALLSASEWSRSQDAYPSHQGGQPVLVVQSLADACNVPANSSRLYNILREPKWFLVLDSASHLGPYGGIGAAAVVVERTTTAFFDLASGENAMTAAGLARNGHWTAVSSISSPASVPLYPAPPYSGDPCAPPPGVPTS